MKRAKHPFPVCRLGISSLRAPFVILLLGAAAVLSMPSARAGYPNFGDADPVETTFQGVDAVNEALGDLFSGVFDREPSPAQRVHPPAAAAAPAPAKPAQPAATKTVKVEKSANVQTQSTLSKVIAAHEKAIVTVHTAIWKALPKPWELFSSKSDAAHATAKTDAH